MNTQTRSVDRTRPGEESPGGGLEAGSSSSLLRQARGYASLAGDAYRSCRKNAEAEAELFRRRNTSGQ